MKWIFLLLNLFFLSPSHAQKLEPCLDKMTNFRLMNKMKSIVRATDPFQGKKKSGFPKPSAPVSLNEMIPVDQFCSHLSIEHTKSYLEMIQALDKVRSHLLKEYASTKKISPRFYQAIASGSGRMSSSLTVEDVCQDSESLFSNLGECDPDRFMIARALGINFLKSNARLACQRLLPMMRQSFRKALQCKQKKQKVQLEKLQQHLPGAGSFALPHGKLK